MRFWLDTEFIEDGRTIDLVSIGMVSEDNRKYYAVSSECEPKKANDWVVKNVLSQIDWGLARPRKQIRHEILRFVGDIPENQHTGQKKRPEFWGYYADYDWVILCQLFGTMMDLPDGFPMYCRDIKQWCDELGNPQLPSQEKGLHHALADAEWNKMCWEFLRDLTRRH